MASVYRRKRSPYWWMSYRLPGGRRKNVSSGTQDKYQAFRMALGLEGLSRNYTQDKAVALVAEIGAACGRGSARTVAETLETYLQVNNARWSESSRKSYRAICRQFIRYTGELSISQLSPAHISGYRDDMLTKGRSAKTVRSHLVLLRTVLNNAVEAGYLLSNPASKVATPAPRQSIKAEFSLEQFRQLLRATQGEWHLLIKVAGLTGQRLRDCLSLTADCIADGTIHFQRKKNRDTHVVPVHPELQEGVYTVAEGLLFPILSQCPLTGSNSVSARFRDDILPRIGIVQEYGKNMGGNKQVTRYSFHSLRHMLSTELNRAGVSQETRMLILGHEDRKVSAGYTHASLSDAAKALSLVQTGADKA